MSKITKKQVKNAVNITFLILLILLISISYLFSHIASKSLTLESVKRTINASCHYTEIDCLQKVNDAEYIEEARNQALTHFNSGIIKKLGISILILLLSVMYANYKLR